jgi:lipoate-protein ligase A
MDDGSPDTIVFCSPAAPYVCVGYHQAAAEVLDLGVCRRRGWPVVRRRIGGGAVYLDGAQLFYQAIVHRARAPFGVDRVYARYLAGPVEALRGLGLDARLAPPNEIEVRGRRIAGTGGGQLGDAMVVVGNVLLDFPDARMARAWRAPSSPFRRLAREGLRRHLTTLARELPSPPSMAALREAIAAAYARTLGAPLVPGALTPREVEAIARAEATLASEAFALGGGGARGGLKIARDVYVFEGSDPAARVRVSLRTRAGVVDALVARGAARGTARRFVGRAVALEGGANPAEAVATALAGRTLDRGRRGDRCDTAS